MQKKKIVIVMLVLFFVISFGIVPVRSLAQDTGSIDITFEIGEDDILYANDIPVPSEFNFTSEDITILVDSYLNDPQNLPALDEELHKLLIDISLTIDQPED